MSLSLHATCAAPRRAAGVFAIFILACALIVLPQAPARAQGEGNAAPEAIDRLSFFQILGKRKAVVADFNDDGALDLVVINPNTPITTPAPPTNAPILNLYFGARTGAEHGVPRKAPAWTRFSRLERLSRDVRDPTDQRPLSWAQEIAVGDFNGDGWTDLIVVESGPDQPHRAVVFMNVPAAGSEAGRTLERQNDVYLLGAGRWSIGVGNFKLGDNCDDVAIGCEVDHEIRVLLGKPGAAQGFQFDVGQTILTDQAVGGPLDVCIGLFDTNTVGKNHSAPDLLCLLGGGTKLALYRGVGDGSFNPTPEAKDTGGKVLLALWPGDVDYGDKDLDVLSPTNDDERPVRIKGRGDGKFDVLP